MAEEGEEGDDDEAEEEEEEEEKEDEECADRAVDFAGDAEALILRLEMLWWWVWLCLAWSGGETTGDALGWAEEARGVELAGEIRDEGLMELREMSWKSIFSAPGGAAVDDDGGAAWW